MTKYTVRVTECRKDELDNDSVDKSIRIYATVEADNPECAKHIARAAVCARVKLEAAWTRRTYG